MDFGKVADFTREVASKKRGEFAEWLSCLAQSDKVRHAASHEPALAEEARLRWAESSHVAAEVMAELSDQRDPSANLVNYVEQLRKIRARDPKLGSVLARACDAILEAIDLVSDAGPESVDLRRRDNIRTIVE